jgi:RNA polymerase sigma factor (sigma-70 family)
MAEPDRDLHTTLAAVWREECARIVAAVARVTRDVGLAEDCAQEAWVAALEHWPIDGVPDNPAAWLTTTAKRRALDRLRHTTQAQRQHEALGLDADARQSHLAPDVLEQVMALEADPIGDDLLRLVFTACHPVLSTDARVALTLKVVAGLSTAEIARAFLVPEPTVAQRIVRAKKTLHSAQVPFELPPPAELAERLASVLEVVYLVFNEGYTATEGEQWLRPELQQEALRLGRVLATLAPEEPEVAALLALMQLQASRNAARVDAAGGPVLLTDQDRGRWDRGLIDAGLSALQRAEALATSHGRPLGPYALQAAIAACHARAPTADATDWPSIAALYQALARTAPSPVVELNRAVAVAMAQGPAAGLVIVDALRDDPRLAGYHWLPSVRADLLARLARQEEARAEFERAAAMAGNAREKALLLQRAAALAPPA